MIELEGTTRNLLLISSSNVHGQGYLDHVESDIRRLLGNIKNVLFIPFALYDRDAYAAKVRERLGRMGFTVDSLHLSPHPKRSVEEAQAIFIGGKHLSPAKSAL
jgi:dipeptidase E